METERHDSGSANDIVTDELGKPVTLEVTVPVHVTRDKLTKAIEDIRLFSKFVELKRRRR